MKHILVAVGISVAVLALLFGLQTYTTHQAEVRTARYVRSQHCTLYMSVPDYRYWLASEGGFKVVPAAKIYSCPSPTYGNNQPDYILIDDTAVQP